MEDAGTGGREGFPVRRGVRGETKKVFLRRARLGLRAEARPDRQVESLGEVDRERDLTYSARPVCGDRWRGRPPPLSTPCGAVFSSPSIKSSAPASQGNDSGTPFGELSRRDLRGREAAPPS